MSENSALKEAICTSSSTAGATSPFEFLGSRAGSHFRPAEGLWLPSSLPFRNQSHAGVDSRQTDGVLMLSLLGLSCTFFFFFFRYGAVTVVRPQPTPPFSPTDTQFGLLLARTFECAAHCVCVCVCVCVCARARIVSIFSFGPDDGRV
jgi:hypothetical protein